MFRVTFLYRRLQTLPDSQLVEFLFLFYSVFEWCVLELEELLLFHHDVTASNMPCTNIVM